jgi:REP element-mobilizing transposase RayT
VLHRKPLRLETFDYASEGLSLITVCTRARQCVLGDVRDETVVLSRFGEIVRGQLEGLPVRLGVDLDSFVVMPNHVHAIVCLARIFHLARALHPARRARQMKDPG